MSGEKVLETQMGRFDHSVRKVRCDADKGPILEKDYSRRGREGIRDNIEGSALLLSRTRTKISDGPEWPHSTSDGRIISLLV